MKNRKSQGQPDLFGMAEIKHLGAGVAIILAIGLVLACRFPFLNGSRPKVTVEDPEISKIIRETPCGSYGRGIAAETIFRDLGAKTVRHRFERAENIVAQLGNGDEEIIVGAHYDKTTLGCGAIDNWTGISLLSGLYRRAKGFEKSDKKFTFVAFGNEEKGLWGSTAMVESIGAKGKRPCAMVNLDSFGFESVWALESASSRKMLMLASDLERSRGGSFSIRNYRGATSDSKPFAEAGIPAITFSGLGVDWRKYLHKEEDRVSAVDTKLVSENLDFLSEFLEMLNKTDCESLL
ncbi:MAG: M28 family peptidase [Pyrinomonadaceae bacterium]